MEIDKNILKIKDNLIPSEGKKCSKCGRGDLPFMHPDYLCDYCFFGDHEKFPQKNGLASTTTTNIWDMLKATFGILFLIFLIWWIYIQVQGNRSNSSETSECGYGYHLEGYTTSYGETVTECFKD